MQCAAFGIWDLDVGSQTVTYSPTWKRLLGYADEAVAESTAVWRERVHADDLQPMLAAQADVLAAPSAAPLAAAATPTPALDRPSPPPVHAA